MRQLGFGFEVKINSEELIRSHESFDSGGLSEREGVRVTG